MADHKHVCPVWIGYLLASPIRRLFQDPVKILQPYVKAGMKVLDFGCAMGFFSLPLARLVGSTGRVVCVDVQAKMIESVNKRAAKAGLFDIVETRVCPANTFGIEDVPGEFDFALLMAVVHEVPDNRALFAALGKALKQGATLLIAEPKNHVPLERFEQSVSLACENGFEVIDHPKIRGSHAAAMMCKG